MIVLLGLAVLALLALRFAARHPGRIFVAALLVAMFSAPLSQITGVAPLAALDEAASVYAVATCVLARKRSGQSLRLPFGAALFGVFVLAGLVSGIQHGVPALITAAGLLSMVKGFLFGVAACQLNVSSQMFDRGLRVGFKVLMVVAACIVANVAAPVLWTSLLIEPGAEIGGPLGGYPLVGPFSRPGALSRLCAMTALVCVAYAMRRRWPAHTTAMVGLLIGSVIVVGASKSLLALGAGIGVLILLQLKRRPSAVIAALVLPAAFIVAGAPLVSGIAQDVARYSADTSARSQLAAGSVELAGSEFPLGVGFGRYGSPTAAENYSPHYFDLGFGDRWGLAPYSGAYLTDTAWPAILGESGWLGAVAFAAALVVIVTRTLALMRQQLPDRTQLLAMFTLLLVVASLVESTSGPVFTSAPSFPLMWVAVGLLTGAVRGPGPDAAADQAAAGAQRTGAPGRDD